MFAWMRLASGLRQRVCLNADAVLVDMHMHLGVTVWDQVYLWSDVLSNTATCNDIA